MLSPVIDLLMELAPCGARPINRPLRSVCLVTTRHLTYPLIDNLYLIPWVTPQGHVSTLSGWVYPIQPVMNSRSLSVAGLRFLDPPPPPEEFCRPYGGLTRSNLDLIGVLMFRSAEMRLGGVPSLLRGVRCLCLRLCRPSTHCRE
jgi:hypothetical protein